MFVFIQVVWKSQQKFGRADVLQSRDTEAQVYTK